MLRAFPFRTFECPACRSLLTTTWYGGDGIQTARGYNVFFSG
jgi:hypothetical protein